jgi:iron complex outermembrane receptor protein
LSARRWPFVLALTLGLASTRAAEAQETIVAPAPLAPIEVTYPEGAHGDAEVVLEVLVAEDGSVVRITLRSGAEPFAEIARRRVETVLFSPATRNGIPIRARIAVRISFHEPPPPDPRPDTAPAPDADGGGSSTSRRPSTARPGSGPRGG